MSPRPAVMAVDSVARAIGSNQLPLLRPVRANTRTPAAIVSTPWSVVLSKSNHLLEVWV